MNGAGHERRYRNAGARPSAALRSITALVLARTPWSLEIRAHNWAGVAFGSAFLYALQMRAVSAADLKAVYRADTAAQAEQELQNLSDKSGARYPTIEPIWRRNWERRLHKKPDTPTGAQRYCALAIPQA
jgi:hypothetical protein